MKTISLFSGAGGLDIGFIRAGFEIILANDFDKDACASYKKNIGNHIECGDINVFEKDIINHKDNLALLIGGPPCQGFSVAGKMNPNDPRSKHIWTFANFVDKLQPKAFVMENVKALGKLKKWEPLRKELLKRFRDSGYSVNYTVLNASDFDVPQSRERVFFIGFRNNSKIIPDLEKMIESYKIKSKTVREVLSKLDKAGTGNNQGICKAKITIAPNPILRKSPYAGMLFNGMGRPVRLDGYCSTLPASMGGNKTPIIDEIELYNNGSSWINSYHKKLIKGNKPNIKETPIQLRRLTVKEASTIQTFPFDYEFIGSQSSKFKQIGNAVPCNLGYHVAKMIMDYLINKEIDTFKLESSNQLKLEIIHG